MEKLPRALDHMACIFVNRLYGYDATLRLHDHQLQNIASDQMTEVCTSGPG